MSRLHEASSIDNLSLGIANHGCSIRIPYDIAKLLLKDFIDYIIHIKCNL